MPQLAKVVARLLATVSVAGVLLIPGVSVGAGAAPDPDPALKLTFDPDWRSSAASAGAVIHTQFPQPDRVQGVRGRAWRSDGFSSWVSAPLNLAPLSGFTVAGWVVLESYPSDREVPVDGLTRASLSNQADAKYGFDLFIDTFAAGGCGFPQLPGRASSRPARFPFRSGRM
jgi:hypothetical protein